ncbi:TIGR04222 domain-containing membrane protein [Qipengyuania qiaonensis]|uniref:TIGR04222 domain-containing membrane protein n=1 Tax=Qipengyuania qiaonensis TaxID=2867240 RepID=A0ABS7J106_9SPHN|nr:TIGR04222 domain-containing membrane protein [Qipengyuania qiaonensis]MBX7481028.1 TIGR04222 domain-containing membrane protein [Qipengyuania qiaonensis]
MVTSFSSYSGSEFLVFYAALIAAAAVAGIWMPHFLRAEGRDQRVTDTSEIAVLAAGGGRFAEMVLARLLGSGVLTEGSKNKLRVARAGAGETAAERAISGQVGEFGITEAFKTLKPHAEHIERGLIDRELLIDRGDRWMLRLAGTLPYLAVLAVGWYRRAAGEALGEPTGLLTMLMVLTGILALWRFFKLDPRTRAGQNVLDAAREQSVRLKSAPTNSELGLGVALFGTAILAGTPYSQLHAMRQSATGDGGGGYSSDGGGDSGGDGGGGCGGCGG